MKKISTSILLLIAALSLRAQPQGAPPEGGFGGFQMPEIKMEYSAKYADIDYAGDHEWQPWRKSLHSFAQKIFK